MKPVLNKIIGCVFLLFISVVSKPQPNELPDIYADRPGMATPPSIAEPTSFQIETGFSFEKNMLEKPSQQNIGYNSTLLRYGINKNSEIRLQTDYLQVKTDSLITTGFNPGSMTYDKAGKAKLAEVTITPRGWQKIGELSHNMNSKTAFIAMWFSEDEHEQQLIDTVKKGK